MNPPDFPADGIMTERVRLCAVTRADAEALLAFQIENRAHLQPWEPLRAPEFFTLPAAEQRLALMEQQMTDGAALHLLLRGRITGAVLGECNFTNIVRGPFQACFLGFSIGGRYEGRGLMGEALGAKLGPVWEHQVDKQWYFAVNRSKETQTVKRTSLVDIGRGEIYIEYNGWPAGTIDPKGGIIAAGEGANEDTFIAALDAAITTCTP